MKLYAPSYYKNFRCIADKCTHSCCVGWEIDVDNEALEKYKSLKNEYGAVIRDSICIEDTPHFKLCEDERCPHLDERGLCRIITNVGENYLCDICREHPRFYNYTSVCELGIGMSCIEAARLILSSPDYATLEEIGTVDADEDGLSFDGRVPRGKTFEILQDKTLTYNEKLEKIHLNFPTNVGEDNRFLKILDSLEYLDSGHKNLFMNYSKDLRPEGMDNYLERFLAYFIYRHCTEALDIDDFCSRLCFCLFCERLFASLICYKSAKSLEEISSLATIISEEIEYSEDNTESLIL